MADFFFGNTDTGKLRTNNEDTFIVQPVGDGSCIAACVIDGVGGYEGGEIAAAIGRETIQAQVAAAGTNWLQTMKEALVQANTKIVAERHNNEQHRNMACVATLAIADMANNQFYYAHVGDTRLYLYRDASLIKVTHDHSFVGFLEDNKRLTEAEAMRHPKRNEINKALGFDAHIEAVKDYIETGVSPFLPADILLLCSDGLSDMVDSDTITGILNLSISIEEKVDQLIKAANTAGGKDNITVVLVQNTNKPVKLKATKPAVVKKNETPHPKKAAEREVVDSPPPYKKTTPIVVPILSILCVLLIGAVIWLWPKDKPDQMIPGSTVAPAAAPTPRNKAEQQLLDSIQATTLLLWNDSTASAPVTVTDSLYLSKDSLIIKGNGLVLQSDTAYNGPALVIDSLCHYIGLEDMTLQNFDVGILATKAVVHLKRVRFINCRIPVQYQYVLPQQPVSGTLSHTIFKQDSLPKANRP